MSLSQYLLISHAYTTSLALAALALASEDLSDGEEDEMFEELVNHSTTLDDDATSPPVRKRARTNKNASPANRKKGCLKQLLGMPLEVFSEIACHLTPSDLLAFARSNKLFRTIFMSRSSLPIWQCAITKVDELPSCPPDVPAPLYTSLIYSKTCSECGARALRKMDTRLRVRLCVACRDSLIEVILEDDWKYDLVPISSDIDPKRSSQNYCLKRDLEALNRELEQYPDETALGEWKENRKTKLEERYEHAAYLDDFLSDMEWDRATEIQELKQERMSDIEERLYDDGWTYQDLTLPSELQSQWNQLVLQPKPLTDRIWKNLQPKLTSLLEASREYNTPAAKRNRLLDRQAAAHEFLSYSFKAFSPLAEVAVYWTESPDEEPVVAKLYVPFPTTADALNWGVIRELVPVDRPLEELRTKLCENTRQIGSRLGDWMSDIYRDLSQIMKNRRTVETEEDEQKSLRRSQRQGKAALESTCGTEFPRFVITFTEPDGRVVTSVDELSDDIRLLIRGDNVFRSTVSGYMFYPEIVPHPVITRTLRDGQSSYYFGENWNSKNVESDGEKSKVARMLLERMGGLDRTWPELKAMGNAFVCARCKWELPTSWDQLVLHYSNELLRWENGQKSLHSRDSTARIIFNNTHDLSLDNRNSIASILNPTQSTDLRLSRSQANGGPRTLMTCLACKELGVEAIYVHYDATDKESSPIISHLMDVHGIQGELLESRYEPWEARNELSKVDE